MLGLAEASSAGPHHSPARSPARQAMMAPAAPPATARTSFRLVRWREDRDVSRAATRQPATTNSPARTRSRGSQDWLLVPEASEESRVMRLSPPGASSHHSSPKGKPAAAIKENQRHEARREERWPAAPGPGCR